MKNKSNLPLFLLAWVAAMTFFACGSDDDIPTGGGSSGGDFIQYDIDGGTQTLNVGSSIVLGYSSGSFTTINEVSFYLTDVSTITNPVTLAGVSFVHTADMNDAQAIYNALPTGSWTYGSTTDKIAGVMVFVKDAGGTMWVADVADGPVSGSFNLTSKGALPNNALGQFVEVAGTFSGTFYDGNGNSKQVTNGSFDAQMQLVN